MTGGLMQLVAYGAQDIYLTGNPMITYFKVVYRRHTNFAMESIQQTFSGNANFGSRVTCLISRNGDLVSGITLEATLPTLGEDQAWVDDVGHHLIQQVDVEIGGQLIDRHYADWLEIWAQLSVPAGHEVGYRKMIGQSQTVTGGTAFGLQEVGDTANGGSNSTEERDRKIYVPLQFWFCRNVGLALPLIALQYHEVKVTVQFADGNKICRNPSGKAAVTPTGSLSASLWVDYIYLDTDERRRFAQVSHEYLIEQLQFSGDENYSSAGNQTISLNFNHPVKELVWVCKPTHGGLQPSNYTSLDSGNDDLDKNCSEPGSTLARNPVVSAKLQLNGHDRFSTRDGSYFNLVQTKCHTRIPQSPGINVYSFALKPEDHQPSGSCNFSRIDNSRLVLSLQATTDGVSTGITKVYATNYNVLRIMSGMGGLAYSN